MKLKFYDGLSEHKRLLLGTALLFGCIVLIDVFMRSYRVNGIIKSCSLAFGPLDEVQKDSIRLIVRAFDKYGDKDLNKLAYILATARYESNFRPIEERRAAPSQTEVYNRQNRYWGTGYWGRGFVQLTHQKNYRKMSDFLGVDLVKNPSLALDPNNAAKILVYGMLNGLFTRQRLSQYINGSIVDFYQARKTVNGLDRAGRVAGYAEKI
ncbi:glycoside hydrolase family 19 protein [Aureispira anguillae]|uniref:Glycoside hydrolase family 19 catalytic domain-containing protein n=1 Tax=Aureispira anguillae TaxID=2864201 RepID=A0A916DV14_9BACT|nr:glycoside hydrolase family 19 protein [Aureispira anguillae]BDS13045.1 hypothetical protein AsAng_0037730 [Aureispira anguillae]